MKLSVLLPLAALSNAFVIVDEAEANIYRVADDIKEASKSFLDKVPSRDDVSSYIKATVQDFTEFSENALDKAVHVAVDAVAFQCHSSMTAFNPLSWLESAELPFQDDVETDPFDAFDILADPPKKPRHPPPHKRPHRHHHKSNMTIYEMISKSKYTTKLAKLINEFEELVHVLNSTSTNVTLFAPTDAAFEKLPPHKKPSKELIKKVLTYHVAHGLYPAGRVAVSHTIPSAYSEKGLGGEAQRLRVGLGLWKGLNINFFSKIVAADIFGTNGVIHAVDHIILFPPPALKIIELLPGEFSTLQLALTKTGLSHAIKTSPHTGGTFFAPSNMAFKKLGPKINAFLFSKRGKKYLTALLKYHIVANQTLYSDAFYKAKEAQEPLGADDAFEVQNGIPKGRFHVDLPTLLGSKSLSIDIARFGRLISMKINGFNSVAVQDGLASDGVVHVVRSVLIPPKMAGGIADRNEDLTVEELKERLDAHVEQKDWWEL